MATTTHTLNGEIADLVEAARKAAGLTQEELAREVGIPFRTYGYLVAGHADWKAVQVARIARSLALPVSDLWPAGVI